MSPSDLVALTPLIVPALTGTIVMLVAAFGGRSSTIYWTSLVGIGLSVASIGLARGAAPQDVTSLLRVDMYALLFLTVLYSATGILAVLSRPYLQARGGECDAFYALLLFAATGMGVLACSNHFAALFLGLEILTVALYTLIGYLRGQRTSLEAAAKYLVLAALASGFLLFGIALVYAATGSLELRGAAEGIAALSASGRQPEAVWALAGGLLLIVGFGFKLALVPFHMWSPDVYQGAPAPVTALIATGSKGAVIAVVLRLLRPDVPADSLTVSILGTLAVLTMFGGNLLALLQDDIKRLLAYSSVAHLGYVLVALAAGGPAGGEAVTFYVLAYVPTTLGAFGVVSILSSEFDTDVDSLTDYRGLGRRRPALASVLTLMLLSLAGIPPTGGFLAKFVVLGAAINAGRSGLAIAMVVASGIAIFYYLRVLVVIYMEAPADDAVETAPGAGRIPLGSSLALAGLVVVILAIGLYPSPWLSAVADAIASVAPG